MAANHNNNINSKEAKKKEFVHSIDAIIQSIVDTDDKNVRNLKLRDLKDKLNGFKSIVKEETKGREKLDVVIFTIVPVEFNYTNKILKFMKPEDKADFKVEGLGYHRFQINRSNNLRPLNAAITLVGTAGDVNCSLACSLFFSRYDCDLAILCGIAAGLRTEAPIYSTIVGNSVVNYEFQRIEANSIEYRPKIFTLGKLIANNLTNLTKGKDIVVKEIIRNIKKNLEKNNTFKLELLKKIEVKDGVIASGAKLLADGKTLASLREVIKIEKGIIAAEMEGSGFVPACEIHQRNWMLFRGISDYGEKDKNNKNNKKYQKIAVVSAATTMLHYLVNHYETPSESGSPEVKDLKF